MQDDDRSFRGAKGGYLEACRAVTDRATQTLKIAEDNKLSLLTIALDHLTLSRAALYESPLRGSAIRFRLSAQPSEFEATVSGLRRAGQMVYLPLGLLTRAWQRCLLGRRPAATARKGDLHEAWEIASRGPMLLFLADIHREQKLLQWLCVG